MANGVIPKYMDGTDTGWKEIPLQNITGGPLRYRWQGNIFFLRNTAYIKLTSNLSDGGSVQIGTIPEGEYPSITVGYGYNDSNNKMFLVKLQNGRVEIKNSSGASITTSNNLVINAIMVN